PFRHEYPPAHTSPATVASTAWRPLPWMPGFGTVGDDQPFGPRWRTSGRTAPFVATVPTAQTSPAPAAVTARKTPNPPVTWTVPPGTGRAAGSGPGTSTWSSAERGRTPPFVDPSIRATYFPAGAGSPYASRPSQSRCSEVERPRCVR